MHDCRFIQFVSKLWVSLKTKPGEISHLKVLAAFRSRSTVYGSGSMWCVFFNPLWRSWEWKVNTEMLLVGHVALEDERKIGSNCHVKQGLKVPMVSGFTKKAQNADENQKRTTYLFLFLPNKGKLELMFSRWSSICCLKKRWVRGVLYFRVGCIWRRVIIGLVAIFRLIWTYGHPGR